MKQNHNQPATFKQEPWHKHNLTLYHSFELKRQQNKATLHIAQGSVGHFGGQCIVNAANESLAAGEGVDAAITDAGGKALRVHFVDHNQQAPSSPVLPAISPMNMKPNLDVNFSLDSQEEEQQQETEDDDKHDIDNRLVIEYELEQPEELQVVDWKQPVIVDEPTDVYESVDAVPPLPADDADDITTVHRLGPLPPTPVLTPLRTVRHGHQGWSDYVLHKLSTSSIKRRARNVTSSIAIVMCGWMVLHCFFNGWSCEFQLQFMMLMFVLQDLYATRGEVFGIMILYLPPFNFKELMELFSCEVARICSSSIRQDDDLEYDLMTMSIATDIALCLILMMMVYQFLWHETYWQAITERIFNRGKYHRAAWCALYFWLNACMATELMIALSGKDLSEVDVDLTRLTSSSLFHLAALAVHVMFCTVLWWRLQKTDELPVGASITEHRLNELLGFLLLIFLNYLLKCEYGSTCFVVQQLPVMVAVFVIFVFQNYV